MKVFKEIVPLKKHLIKGRLEGKKVGLVPTMGALHEGHFSLIKSSVRDNDVTVCSIYVNPTQFNNPEDLQKYPRDLDKDIASLESAGCDIVFCPSDKVMYPARPSIKFDFGTLGSKLEGKFRPGHFSGVAVVVSKLLHIVNPDNVYFGQKDLQQFLIIKTLVNDLSFSGTMHSEPTVREEDGLAKSSRNLRLRPEERKKSIVLYQTLLEVEKLLKRGTPVKDCKQLAKEKIEGEGVQLEYFEVLNANNLEALQNISSAKNVALCVAAYIGDVRLIDNIIFRGDS